MSFTALKSRVPAPLWNRARAVYYRLRLLRFWRGWLQGLAFDLFQRDYRTEGMRFRVPRWLMSRTHRARFYTDSHERDERALVHRWMPADATVLELGACLGVVSCVINRRLADPQRQLSVEPNPQLQEVLTLNRDQNGCGFRIADCLVSRESDGTFYLNEAIVMASATQATERSVRVPVLTVEELEARHGLSFDAGFMDIQGGELGFKTENPALLARCKAIIMEFHPHIIGAAACERCRELLRQAGLRPAEVIGITEAWVR